RWLQLRHEKAGPGHVTFVIERAFCADLCEKAVRGMFPVIALVGFAIGRHAEKGISLDHAAPWKTISGRQISGFCADYRVLGAATQLVNYCSLTAVDKRFGIEQLRQPPPRMVARRLSATASTPEASG